ncbi:MAG: hypothetical protein AAGF66_13630 [Cyanobacteria bacterium P01_H01_bin.119]
MKLILPTLVNITVILGGLLAAERAAAQISIPVVSQCPQATWAEGYHIHELIPLGPLQYKTAAIAHDFSNVRYSVGFASQVAFTMNTDEDVLVTGEAWDMSCNQWMQIRIGNRRYWTHGANLRLHRSSGL